MNGRDEYITTKITLKEGGGGGTAKKKEEAQRKERGSWDARGDGDSCPQAREPFSLGRWAV